jgi:hypothetical protein
MGYSSLSKTDFSFCVFCMPITFFHDYSAISSNFPRASNKPMTLHPLHVVSYAPHARHESMPVSHR